jgi:hypothetical protein
MDIAAAVCSVLLAVGSVWPGVQLTRLNGRLWSLLRNRGITPTLARSIGIAGLVGAAVLIAGLFVPVIGLLACLLLGAVYVWAVGQRVVYGDYGNPDMRNAAMFPLGMLVFSVITGSIIIAAGAA